MQHQSVSSSNIRSIGYDAATQTMEVSFIRGGLYRYSNVPEDAHRALMAAPSIGSHFSKEIRDVYPAKKLS